METAKETTLFKFDPIQKGTAAGNQQNLDGIAKVKPILNTIGFDLKTKAGEKNARKTLNPSELHRRNKEELRNTEEGVGNEQLLYFIKDDTKNISVQVRVISRKSQVTSSANYNIPSTLTDSAIKNKWERPFWKKQVMNSLSISNKYLLIYNITTNWYLLMRYDQAPLSNCQLVAKGNNKERLNIHVDGMLDLYKPFSSLLPELKSILNIK